MNYGNTKWNHSLKREVLTMVTWRYDRGSGNCNLTRNILPDFNGSRTHGLFVGAAELYQLSYEGPYIWECCCCCLVNLLLAVVVWLFFDKTHLHICSPCLGHIRFHTGNKTLFRTVYIDFLEGRHFHTIYKVLPLRTHTKIRSHFCLIQYVMVIL